MADSAPGLAKPPEADGQATNLVVEDPCKDNHGDELSRASVPSIAEVDQAVVAADLADPIGSELPVAENVTVELPENLDVKVAVPEATPVVTPAVVPRSTFKGGRLGRKKWKDDEVRLLIKTWGDIVGEMQLKGSQIWERVGDRMRKNGCNRNHASVRKKWSELLCPYKAFVKKYKIGLDGSPPLHDIYSRHREDVPEFFVEMHEMQQKQRLVARRQAERDLAESEGKDKAGSVDEALDLVHFADAGKGKRPLTAGDGDCNGQGSRLKRATLLSGTRPGGVSSDEAALSTLIEILPKAVSSWESVGKLLEKQAESQERFVQMFIEHEERMAQKNREFIRELFSARFGPTSADMLAAQGHLADAHAHGTVPLLAESDVS
eukprot:jgi/Mesvir1/12065/Mv00349-RA.1